MKETNASIEAKSKDIVEKSKQEAEAEQQLGETKESKAAVLVEAGHGTHTVSFSKRI